MAGKAWICAECFTNVHDPYQRYYDKREIVRADHLHRLMSKAQRLLCKPCAERIKAEIEHQPLPEDRPQLW